MSWKAPLLFYDWLELLHGEGAFSGGFPGGFSGLVDRFVRQVELSDDEVDFSLDMARRMDLEAGGPVLPHHVERALSFSHSSNLGTEYTLPMSNPMTPTTSAAKRHAWFSRANDLLMVRFGLEAEDFTAELERMYPEGYTPEEAVQYIYNPDDEPKRLPSWGNPWSEPWDDLSELEGATPFSELMKEG